MSATAEHGTQTPETVPPPPAPVPAVGTQATNLLFADIADDAGNLVTEHAYLLQAEVRDGVRKIRILAGLLAFGVVCAILGTLFAGISGVYGIQDATELPLWVCWLIVGGGMLLIGGGLAVACGMKLISVNMIPTRTLKSLSETWTWLVKRSK